MDATTAMDEEEWIELPGLFHQHEFSEAARSGLDMRVRPLVIVNGQVLYGLYVRLDDSAASAEDALNAA